MVAAARPFAALSSGLLARKGEARPAMRRQATLAEAGDELGWNDMGAPLPGAEDTQAALLLPAVLAQREDLAEALDIAVEVEVEPLPVEAAERASPGRRTAFTLRLDSERHLRLRLAAATRRISAQRLLTQALDDYLTAAPAVEPLAERLPKPTSVRTGK